MQGLLPDPHWSRQAVVSKVEAQLYQLLQIISGRLSSRVPRLEDLKAGGVVLVWDKTRRQRALEGVPRTLQQGCHVDQGLL